MANTNPPSPSANRRPFLPRLLPYLTTTSHTSALLFSSFLLVHLASPIASSVHLGFNDTRGCNDVASKWMILGRVYYQNVKFGTEAVFVWGSLGVHLGASLLKRGVLVWMRRRRKREIEIDEEKEVINSTSKISTSSLLRIPSLHTTTAYILTPFILHHIILHRLIPSSSTFPINQLSPSELDHNFTAYGLQRYPFISWFSLSTLVITGGIHVAGGVGIIGKRLGGAKRRNNGAAGDSSLLPLTKNKARRKKSPVPPALIASALVLTGVWAIAADPDAHVPSGSWIAKRYDAVYRQLWPFSLVK